MAPPEARTSFPAAASPAPADFALRDTGAGLELAVVGDETVLTLGTVPPSLPVSTDSPGKWPPRPRRTAAEPFPAT